MTLRESEHSTKRVAKPRRAAVAASKRTDEVPGYAALVRDAKKYYRELVKDDWAHKMRLGKIIHLLETHYRDESTAKFVKKAGIDIAVCTLERWRSVYRAYYVDAEIGPGAEISYSVARALQTHPDRIAIITKHPKMTKCEAEALMAKLQNHESDEAPEDEEQDETKLATDESEVQREVRRWCRDLFERANKAAADAKMAKSTDPEIRQVLCDAIAAAKLLPQLRKAIAEWIKLADDLEQLVSS